MARDIGTNSVIGVPAVRERRAMTMASSMPSASSRAMTSSPPWRGMKSGRSAKLAILHDEARHEVVAEGLALRQRDDRLDVKDQPVILDGLAQQLERDHRLGHDVGIGLGRPACVRRRSTSRRRSSSSATVSVTCLTTVPSTPRSDSIGVEPLAGLDVGEGIDALAERRAGLRVGRQQARQVLDGLFEPRLGAAAQLALDQEHRHGSQRRWR